MTRHADNAIVRLRAAMLDLTAAGRHTDANDVAAIIERIKPPSGRTARAHPAPGRQLGPARSEGVAVSPAAAPPATTWQPKAVAAIVECTNCRNTMAAHCTVHLLPCCPGSLMHGGDEGTWTSESR